MHTNQHSCAQICTYGLPHTITYPFRFSRVQIWISNPAFSKYIEVLNVEKHEFAEIHACRLGRLDPNIEDEFELHKFTLFTSIPLLPVVVVPFVVAWITGTAVLEENKELKPLRTKTVHIIAHNDTNLHISAMKLFEFLS